MTRGVGSNRAHVRVRRSACEVPPRSPAQLAAWVRLVLGIDVPPGPLIAGGDSPLDYLSWSFFERRDEGQPRDAVVWSSRGGGKTFYAAVATVLDLIFKPGVEVKILAGSREQAQRMHEHLRRFFERPPLASLLDGRITDRRARLLNGSGAEVLAQSHASVRGTRPQKLRCDEVELFDEDVWQAAQLVTRSEVCHTRDGPVLVRGSVEALSTCHVPGGLMSRLIADADSRRLFRWTAIDLLERCPASRECRGCELWDECAGRAKLVHPSRTGHFHIDDAVTMKRRAGRETWESEMLCLRPSRRAAVFPEFDPSIHVVDIDAGALAARRPPAKWIAGMDFGFRSPAIILWGCIDETGVLRIVAERAASGALLESHIAAITSGDPAAPGARVLPPLPIPEWIGVDPAGAQRSEQTGLSAIAALRRAGLAVRHRRVPLEDGLRAIRRRLRPASGAPMLFIDRRCATLIDSLTNYRYPDNPAAATPMKDGHDHAADALRYLLVNLESTPYAERRWY